MAKVSAVVTVSRVHAGPTSTKCTVSCDPQETSVTPFFSTSQFGPLLVRRGCSQRWTLHDELRSSQRL